MDDFSDSLSVNVNNYTRQNIFTTPWKIKSSSTTVLYDYAIYHHYDLSTSYGLWYWITLNIHSCVLRGQNLGDWRRRFDFFQHFCMLSALLLFHIYGLNAEVWSVTSTTSCDFVISARLCDFCQFVCLCMCVAAAGWLKTLRKRFDEI